MSTPNNLIWIVFDSCRYDSFVNAKTPNISKLGETEKRYSFASWTYPSHAVYLMGACPHKSPRGVFASEVYREDFARWSERLNIPDISFKKFVPRLSLAAFLRTQGYLTRAMVSLPVLNQTTVLNQHFDSWELMPSHNDFRAMVEKLTFERDRPTFYFLNVGETHYPYTLPGESGDELPRIHGVHGVFKHLDDHLGDSGDVKDDMDFFNMDQLKILQEKQRTNVEYLDGVFGDLVKRVPPNTYFIVTADHGECFGEDGYFGHGPIMHEKVFEVFFVEGPSA